MQIRTNYSLLNHNSFGLDVKAKEYVEYENVEELQSYLAGRDKQLPLLHIGGGNNLLFTKDYDGTILHSAIKGFEVLARDDKNVLVRMGAAEVWDDMVDRTLLQGYFGLENLSLIPSEVGASAVQNIGAYGSEVKDFIENVELVDLSTGEQKTVSNAKCDFAYRYSKFKGPWKGHYAVTYVTFKLSLTYTPNLSYHALASVATPEMSAMELRNAIIKVRESKLPNPKVLGNAGSFFMNPIVDQAVFDELSKKFPDMPHYVTPKGIKIPAGWLIDQCGWKGKSLGPAAVYQKQALVLVNTGGATPHDIMRLSDAVCADVEKKFGIKIHPEVNWI